VGKARRTCARDRAGAASQSPHPACAWLAHPAPQMPSQLQMPYSLVLWALNLAVMAAYDARLPPPAALSPSGPVAVLLRGLALLGATVGLPFLLTRAWERRRLLPAYRSYLRAHAAHTTHGPPSPPLSAPPGAAGGQQGRAAAAAASREAGVLGVATRGALVAKPAALRTAAAVAAPAGVAAASRPLRYVPVSRVTVLSLKVPLPADTPHEGPAFDAAAAVVSRAAAETLAAGGGSGDGPAAAAPPRVLSAVCVRGCVHLLMAVSERRSAAPVGPPGVALRHSHLEVPAGADEAALSGAVAAAVAGMLAAGDGGVGEEGVAGGGGGEAGWVEMGGGEVLAWPPALALPERGVTGGGAEEDEAAEEVAVLVAASVVRGLRRVRLVAAPVDGGGALLDATCAVLGGGGVAAAGEGVRVLRCGGSPCRSRWPIHLQPRRRGPFASACSAYLPHASFLFTRLLPVQVPPAAAPPRARRPPGAVPAAAPARPQRHVAAAGRLGRGGRAPPPVPLALLPPAAVAELGRLHAAALGLDDALALGALLAAPAEPRAAAADVAAVAHAGAAALAAATSGGLSSVAVDLCAVLQLAASPGGARASQGMAGAPIDAAAFGPLLRFLRAQGMDACAAAAAAALEAAVRRAGGRAEDVGTRAGGGDDASHGHPPSSAGTGAGATQLHARAPTRAAFVTLKDARGAQPHQEDSCAGGEAVFGDGAASGLAAAHWWVQVLRRGFAGGGLEARYQVGLGQHDRFCLCIVSNVLYTAKSNAKSLLPGLQGRAVPPAGPLWLCADGRDRGGGGGAGRHGRERRQPAVARRWAAAVARAGRRGGAGEMAREGAERPAAGREGRASRVVSRLVSTARGGLPGRWNPNRDHARRCSDGPHPQALVLTTHVEPLLLSLTTSMLNRCAGGRALRWDSHPPP
jgi:hypothetical protein